MKNKGINKRKIGIKKKQRNEKASFEIICPCCNKVKTLKRQVSSFLQQIKYLHYYYAEDLPEDSYYFADAKAQKKDSWLRIMWACNGCLNSGKAIASKTYMFIQQAYTPPVFAFFDLPRRCKKCTSSFIFRKEEWRYWVDELGFYYRTEKKFCDSCQPIQLNNKQLNKLIQIHRSMAFDKDYVKQAIRISNKYLKMGYPDRAKGYLKRIINKIPIPGNEPVINKIKVAYYDFKRL